MRNPPLGPWAILTAVGVAVMGVAGAEGDDVGVWIGFGMVLLANVGMIALIIVGMVRERRERQRLERILNERRDRDA